MVRHSICLLDKTVTARGKEAKEGEEAEEGKGVEEDEEAEEATD